MSGRAIYAVVHRDGRDYWTKIGEGFTRRDPSEIELTLDRDVRAGETVLVREWDAAPAVEAKR